nr:reverse transcriptase domain-containing protein [Tanacetum cinerariifolium]
MRTRSSSNLPIVSSKPSTSNPKRRNRRRSKQPFILEESPIDTMADQRTMAELLRAPTERYAEAIMAPSILAEQFELKHSLINMMTTDQFFRLKKDNPHDHIRWFNKITSTIKYKDVPNSAIKLMLFPFSLRISSNPRNRQIAQPGMNMGQDRHMQMIGGNGGNHFRQYAGHNAGNLNGYNAVQNVGNQVAQNLRVQNDGIQNQIGNGNLVVVHAEGNATQLLITQKEEAGIQLQAEEYDQMAAAADLDEIEEGNANCILMANLQQASSSDGSAEVHENYDNNEIFNMFTQEEQYTKLLEPIPKPQQMMKGSDIGIQEKKAKLFNEWERFTSNEGESIESYYHRFLKLMNDLKRNKHFPEKIASNLKFLNNLQPEWSRYVTIVHQTKDLHTADYTQFHNGVEMLLLFIRPRICTQLIRLNYPTTGMNMALALMDKEFKLNYSTPTNNNQRISSNLRNSQIAQPGMNMGQDRQMQMVGGNGGNQFRQYAGHNAGNLNGYNAVQNVGNQVAQNPRVQNDGIQ